MNYDQEGNRYTAIFLKHKDGTYERLPFDIVRFNVDKDADAKKELVPASANDSGKVFEKIWIVTSIPWRKKVVFNGVS